MNLEIGNIIMEVFFTIVMTVSVPWAAAIGIRLYVVKKVAEILTLCSPGQSTVSLANFQKMGKNSRIFSLYYYWLWFAEKFVQLFLFGTLFLFFFGFLPIILDAIPYKKPTVLILIAIEIGITVSAWFFRYICEEIGSEVGINLKEVW